MIAYLRPRAGVFALGVLLATVTFVLQPPHTGFWNSHHGWTSAHGLALMTHATPENGFVAYSQALIEEDGSITYQYFDRYPVGFTSTGNLLLRLTDNLPQEVYLMRQVMNVIFLGLLFVAYRLVRLTVENRYLAFAAVTIPASSFYMLYYKDMIHYDTPTVLGLLLVAYMIARYHRGEIRLRWLIVTILLTMSFGRGYVVGFLLAPWFAIEAINLLRKWDMSFPMRMGRVLRHESLWLLVMSVAFGAGWLAYNTTMEARTRGISVAETSIVHSLQRRLPFVEPEEPEGRTRERANYEASAAGWGRFLVNQTERVALWATPLQLAGEMRWRYYPLDDPLEVIPLRLIAALALFPLAGWTIYRARPSDRTGLTVAAVSGLLWMYVMISLSTEHIYVTMYSFGLVLLAWIALLGPLDRRPIIGVIAAMIAVGLYIGSNIQVRATINAEMEVAQHYTSDFSNIRAEIDGDWQTTFIAPEFTRGTCLIQYDICYAPGYYFGDRHTISLREPSIAEYVISPNPFYTDKRFLDAGESLRLMLPLHPDNEIVYFHDQSHYEERTAPADDVPLFEFGESLVIHQWALSGDVTIPACESIRIESWWTADNTPDTNYNMQVVMVGEDGQDIAQANRPLGSLPTTIWETDRFTLDVRTLTVPCDAPSGSYPLILGVYDPETLVSLPAQTTSGESVGNQIYLTNLIVP
jgi:hypothetical protein